MILALKHCTLPQLTLPFRVTTGISHDNMDDCTKTAAREQVVSAHNPRSPETTARGPRLTIVRSTVTPSVRLLGVATPRSARSPWPDGGEEQQQRGHQPAERRGGRSRPGGPPQPRVQPRVIPKPVRVRAVADLKQGRTVCETRRGTNRQDRNSQSAWAGGRSLRCAKAGHL